MISVILFWAGVSAALIIFLKGFSADSDNTKNGALYFPAYMLLAAVVAKYLGM